MLIYVPSQYARDSEDLNSESRALQKLEQSCTWKTKSRQPRFWLKELKKGTLTMLLSGLILEPSEEKNFMARWTSSLGDSLANPSQLQARDSEMTIQETSGMKSKGLQESSDTQLSFLKMLKTSHDTTTIQSEKTYKKWVTQLRKDYSQRVKLAYHTVGEDYSCSHVSQTQTISNPTYYPTPTTQEIAHNNMSLTSTGRRQTKDKRDSHSLNLQDKVRLWRTASASDGKGGNEDYKRKELDGKNPRIKLSQQATYRGVNGQPSKNWPTPRTQMTRPIQVRKDGYHGNLEEAVAITKNWPTAMSRDYKGQSIINPRHDRLPDAATGSDLHHPQSMTTSDGHTHSLTCQRLNPLFVEWLMGFPLGWSNAYEPLEMQSFRQWQQRDLQSL